jgi:hypothetical protein
MQIPPRISPAFYHGEFITLLLRWFATVGPISKPGLAPSGLFSKVKRLVNPPHAYRSYLLRLWQSDESESAVWLASLEDPHTGERRGFANLTSLFQFLSEQAEDDSRSTRPAASRPEH